MSWLSFTSSFLLSIFVSCSHVAASEYPWKYETDEFGGPEFWGLIDKKWEMCSKGKLQSPIDIRPERLLFDPGLRPFHVDRISVASELVNTGQMPRVRIGNSARRPPANLSGGPLNNYRYRIQRIDIHFGRTRDLNGSEHSIDGRKFPMELQLLSYNVDLYANFSVASKSPNGIAAISVLVEIGKDTNEELLKLTVATASVINKNKRVELADLKPWELLPITRDFVTYQGSMTAPGCYETVTWIIVNQPIHITAEDLVEWGKMQQAAVPEKELLFLGPNARSLREHNGRLLRTNIQHKAVSSDTSCALPLPKLSYRSNVVQPQVSQRSPPINIPIKDSKYHRQHKRRHAKAHREPDHDSDLFL